MATPSTGRSANLRRRLEIQERSTSIDTVGGQPTVWTTVGTVWADIQPLSGQEKFAAEAFQTSVTHQILMRYQAQYADPKVMAARRGIEVKDGITRIFNFHAIRDLEERRKMLLIDAEEGMNDG